MRYERVRARKKDGKRNEKNEYLIISLNSYKTGLSTSVVLYFW
jgi:hypothetical protein